MSKQNLGGVYLPSYLQIEDILWSFLLDVDKLHEETKLK